METQNKFEWKFFSLGKKEKRQSQLETFEMGGKQKVEGVNASELRKIEVHSEENIKDCIWGT